MGNFILLLIPAMFMASTALAQNYNPDDATKSNLPPKFSVMSKEASFICGPFLPNQIEGITEAMPLCGGRLGFKTAKGSYLEATVLSGAAQAQRYLMGSLSLRGDTAFDDIIASMYIGADIHYPTKPYLNATTGIYDSDSTSIYFGGHIGGAMWADLTDNLYFRTDLKFNLNPGTSLFLGFSLVLRFDPGGGQDNQNPN